SALALMGLWRASAARRQRAAGRGWLVLGITWRCAALLLIAAALVYPVSATPVRVADRLDRRIRPTLDGMAFMQTGLWAENGQQFALAEDAAAIGWMHEHIDGTPIVLEAHTDPFGLGGRVSTYTGLPTLLGWSWYEQRQRGVAMAN